MKYKTRTLFIYIALSFLIGCITGCNSFIYDAEEVHFGSVAETLNLSKDLLDNKEVSVSEHQITPEINEGDALRHFSQSKRINNSSSKYGLAFIKRNQILYASTQSPESVRRFLSRLIEARQYLISLGKLII